MGFKEASEAATEIDIQANISCVTGVLSYVLRVIPSRLNLQPNPVLRPHGDVAADLALNPGRFEIPMPDDFGQRDTHFVLRQARPEAAPVTAAEGQKFKGTVGA